MYLFSIIFYYSSIEIKNKTNTIQLDSSFLLDYKLDEDLNLA